MASYTVVIVPFRNGLNSLDALRFFLWVKKLKDLEREKDVLWMGLQGLEQVRDRLCSNLENDNTTTEPEEHFKNRELGKESPDTPIQLLAQIQGVNKTLRNLMHDFRRPAGPSQDKHPTEGTEEHQPSSDCSGRSNCF